MITINTRQPEIEKWFTLFHELLHVCEGQLHTWKTIKKCSRERYIEHMSQSLLALLGASGLLKHVRPKQVRRYVRRRWKG